MIGGRTYAPEGLGNVVHDLAPVPVLTCLSGKILEVKKDRVKSTQFKSCPIRGRQDLNSLRRVTEVKSQRKEGALRILQISQI